MNHRRKLDPSAAFTAQSPVLFWTWSDCVFFEVAYLITPDPALQYTLAHDSIGQFVEKITPAKTKTIFWRGKGTEMLHSYQNRATPTTNEASCTQSRTLKWISFFSKVISSNFNNAHIISADQSSESTAFIVLWTMLLFFSILLNCKFYIT